MLDGLRYVWKRPDLMALLGMLFLIATFGLNFPIFIGTMAVSVFHTDARGYSLLSSTMAVGSVVGALLAAGRERTQFSALVVGAGVFGVGCALAAVAPGYLWFAAALALTGVAALTFTNTSNSLLQLSTEPAMRGRVMALRLGIALGTTPIGAPIVGWVADHAGPRWALGVAAASGFGAWAIGMRYLTMARQREDVQPR
jgi:MFS family permease